MNKFNSHSKIYSFFLLLLLFLVESCTSHLQQAKDLYARGTEQARYYQTETAQACFKKARLEAELETKKQPSAQAFTLKGMAEVKLELWEKAKESFLQAFSYGFESGEDWSRQLSLFGLAISFQEMGLNNSALNIFYYLIKQSKFSPIVQLAAQKYTDLTLTQALEKQNSEKEKQLDSLLKTLDSLVSKDLGCGFYHYLRSQVLGHKQDFFKCYEAAVMARELGLPTVEILRDNDNQIIYCYKKLKSSLSSAEFEKFSFLYQQWIKKWNWRGPDIPDWKLR
jgi:hypothetical protein